MVRGVDIFREHFRDFADRYVLIGGTACSLAMDEAGEPFRSTKDLDIVLCVEALDADFVKAFWDFVREGRYQTLQKSTGKHLFYRFHTPRDDNYPFMLELFSRIPDALAYKGDGHLTPIPMGEEASSLSAILLDEDYYRFLHAGKRETAGLPVVGPEHLIPLKARAWLDLTAKRDRGEKVDKQDIRKHLNDVFRLFRIISPELFIELPGAVGDDLLRFLEAMPAEAVDLKSLGFNREAKLVDILATIRRIYQLPA